MTDSKAGGLNFVDLRGTAAPAFHLSDTIDWSCVSAQIKNQVVVVPAREVVHLCPGLEHVRQDSCAREDIRRSATAVARLLDHRV